MSAQLRRRIDVALQRLEHGRHLLGRVAEQHQIATRLERERTRVGDRADDRRADHAQVVGDHGAFELELAAQVMADPPARQARGARIDGGKLTCATMTAARPLPIRSRYGVQVVVEVVELAVVDGELGVRIAVSAGVRREVLRRDGHPGPLGARREAARQTPRPRRLRGAARGRR